MYISEELLAPDTAKRTVNKIRTVIRGLDVMPNRHIVVDWEPWLSMGMRKVVVDKYLAFYLVDDITCTVTVVRVFYGGRDIENIVLGEED